MRSAFAGLESRMEEALRRWRLPAKTPTVLAMAVLVVLGWIARTPLLDIRTADYRNFTRGWYDHIKNNGFAAFGTGFYDYTPSYLYLYWIFQQFFPDVWSLHAIKMICYSFDVFAAVMVWALVRLQRQGLWPLVGFAVVIFLPSVVLTSGAWGQCDVIYSSFLLAFLYAVLRGRPLAACAMYGLALSFKLQAGFVGPMVLLLALRRQIPWRFLFVIPAVYVAMMVPAWIAGRPLSELLLIYLNQYGAYKTVSFNAPNMFQLFQVGYDEAKVVGLLTAGGLAALVILYTLRSRLLLEGRPVILVALLIALMMPYALPKMMYRYFFAADVIAVVFAFYYPRMAFVTVLIQVASVYSYPPFVHIGSIPIRTLALGNLAALLSLVVLLVLISGHGLGPTAVLRRKPAPAHPA